MSTILIILVLAAVSVWLEIKILGKVSLLRNMSSKNMIVGIFLSLGLSWVLGTMFGAAGVVIMIAGLVSTMAAEPFRRMYNKTAETKVRIEKVQYWKKQTLETYHPFLVIMKWVGIILSAPVWLPILMRERHNKGESLFERTP